MCSGGVEGRTAGRCEVDESNAEVVSVEQVTSAAPVCSSQCQQSWEQCGGGVAQGRLMRIVKVERVHLHAVQPRGIPWRCSGAEDARRNPPRVRGPSRDRHADGVEHEIEQPWHPIAGAGRGEELDLIHEGGMPIAADHDVARVRVPARQRCS